MTHLKKYWLLYVILLVVIYFLYRYYKNKDNHRVSGGSDPNQADKDCASGNGGGLPGGAFIGSCTRPKLYPVKSPIKQKCFTSEELGLSEGDQPISVVTDNNGWGTTWFFNFQSGNNFCYVNKKV